MTVPLRLDDFALMRHVVESDDDAWTIAVYVHLLQGAIDAGAITFPITSAEQVMALTALAKGVEYPPPAQPGQAVRLPSPRAITKNLFPCPDMDDFVVKIRWVIDECRKNQFKTRIRR